MATGLPDLADTEDEIALDALDGRYGRLRIVQPRQERAVCESMRRLGQITPAVACRRSPATSPVLLDGFKRLASARTLGMTRLRVRLLDLTESAAVAAIYNLNRTSRGLVDLEEAMVIRVLVREQHLEQTAVGELLGRHKSWVCRRLALVERLSDVVADDVRAGLVTPSVAREVARLPRGNQPEMSACIRRHALSAHDAARLVTLFDKASGDSAQRFLLDTPREALEAHGPARAFASFDPRLGPLTQKLRHRLLRTLDHMTGLTRQLEEGQPSAWTNAERAGLAPVLAQTCRAAGLLGDAVDETARAVESAHAT